MPKTFLALGVPLSRLRPNVTERRVASRTSTIHETPVSTLSKPHQVAQRRKTPTRHHRETPHMRCYHVMPDISLPARRHRPPPDPQIGPVPLLRRWMASHDGRLQHGTARWGLLLARASGGALHAPPGVITMERRTCFYYRKSNRSALTQFSRAKPRKKRKPFTPCSKIRTISFPRFPKGETAPVSVSTERYLYTGTRSGTQHSRTPSPRLHAPSRSVAPPPRHPGASCPSNHGSYAPPRHPKTPSSSRGGHVSGPAPAAVGPETRA
ncbi:hypothetical protein VUR80DRAFT_7406 [Thermomyces stellatus]